MTFPANIYLLSFLAAAAIAFFGLPFWRRLSVRIGMVDAPGERKIHSRTTPLAGGLAVVAAVVLPVFGGLAVIYSGLLGEEIVERLVYGFAARGWQLTAILGGAIGMLVLGALDDLHELKPGPKFGGQLLIAGIVAASGVRITLFVPSVAFSYFVTILWILTLVNAFNFLDNMNGLCAGLGAVAGAAFALWAGLAGQYLVTALALLVVGGLIGFLPHNYPRASSFLGDSGSHLVGFLMATLGILTTFHFLDSPETTRLAAAAAPLLILAVPLFDIASIVVIRARAGKPVYIGDTNHVSHRLVRRGLSKPAAVAALWLVAAAAAALSFLL